eukprot:4891240-Pyramimonas_sp.AAC.1
MPQSGDGSQDAPRGPKNASRRFQVATGPPEAAKMPPSFQQHEQINEVCRVACLLSKAFPRPQ